MKRAIIVLVTAILLVWGPTAGLVKAQEKKAVRVAGAGLLSEWLQESSDRYMKDARTCSITISGATTGIGVQRLMEGNAELAALTRAMTAEEIKKAEGQGLSLGSKLVGHVGLAVVTNSKNSVSELTMEQLAKIFKGEISNWSQVGGPNEPIKVTVRAVPETGAGVLFQEKSLKRRALRKRLRSDGLLQYDCHSLR